MNNVFLNTFGERLEFLMESKGFDITKKGANTALAKQMLSNGCLNFYVNEYPKSKDSARSRIECHRKTDSAEQVEGKWLKAYCDYFKCSADFLFGYINLPTHTDTDIHTQIGLSFDAIKKLKSFTTYRQGEARLAIINYLLQNDDFSIILIDNINSYYSKYFFLQNSVETYLNENKKIQELTNSNILKMLELQETADAQRTISRHTLAEREAATDAARFRIQKNFDNILISLAEYFYRKNNTKAPDTN